MVIIAALYSSLTFSNNCFSSMLVKIGPFLTEVLNALAKSRDSGIGVVAHKAALVKSLLNKIDRFFTLQSIFHNVK